MLRQISYKVLISVILASLGFYLLQSAAFDEFWFNQCCLNLEDVKKDIHKIELKHSIKIKYDVAEKAIPKLWQNPPSNATAEPLDQINLNRHIQTLSRELKKYPTEIIKQNLSNIYLFKSLSFYGVQYGGTSINTSLYLTGGTISEGYDDDYFASLFHHEMSSIFYRSYPFPKEAWSSINSESFIYADSDSKVLKAIIRGNESENKIRLYREGFLSKYGQSTLENDFNLYAEMVFMDPQQLRYLSDKYPRVSQKFKLIKNFYVGISEDFFM